MNRKRAIVSALVLGLGASGSSAARASAPALDYGAGVAARTLPLGSAVYGDVGYDFPAWGEAGPGKLLYGYARPVARASTSVVVNRLDVAVEIYPISFLGLRAGYAASSRMTDTDTIDCSAIACRGLVGTAYAESRLAFGYGGFFGYAALSAQQLTPSLRDRPFSDEQTSLIGAEGGDRLIAQELVLGYKLRENLSAGAYVSAGHMLGTAGSNHLEAVFGRLQRGAWSYMAAAGAYESTTQPRGFTAYGAVEWTGLPSLELR